MPIPLKIVITLLIIMLASELGKRLPHLSGLIATMPITTLLVLLWLNYETGTNYQILTKFTLAVIFGIFPSIFFFIVLYFCFLKGFSFYISLFFAFLVWGFGAIIHQFFLR
ncbi:MAG: DUF3147 family protein [Proteobacteria bacterium]|nr:DUF3147 family protein [Pseudomonadota bacterium]